MLSVFRFLMILSLLFLSACYYTSRYKENGKYRPTADRIQPAEKPVELVPEIQTEPHTCGFHSLSAIYKSYAIDPERARLRFRLGVDKRGNPFDPDTLGTIQPDILRVLSQDGFQVLSLDLEPNDVAKKLLAHLKNGEFALTLIKRRETGNLHWVVLCGVYSDEVEVADSLRTGKYLEPIKDYLENHILNVLLIRPAETHGETRIGKEHLRGVKEMIKTKGKMKN